MLRDDGDEEKLKTLRKKNSELTTSNKDLEDRMRVLKAEHDQLVRRGIKKLIPKLLSFRGDTHCQEEVLVKNASSNEHTESILIAGLQ